MTVGAANQEEDITAQWICPMKAAHIIGQPFGDPITWQKLVLAEKLEHPLLTCNNFLYTSHPLN
jgi:hypothetical protein